MKAPIRVSIIGGSGYGGGELLRLQTSGCGRAAVAVHDRQ
jgi:N-acetyl-gamma-glutamylphosphate reductase